VLAAALTSAASVFAAAPASAAPPAPVGALSVTPRTQLPPDRHGVSTVDIVVSWSSEPARADGVVVCIVQSIRPTKDANYCQRAEDVPARRMHSGHIPVHEGLAYSVSVFAYVADPGREYSKPRMATWHGSQLQGRHARYVTYGDRVTARMTLVDTRSGAELTHQPVGLFVWSSRKSAWDKVKSLRTNAVGLAHFSREPHRDRTYAWRYKGTTGHLPATATTTLHVRYRVTAHLTKTHVAKGRSVRMFGVVRPQTSGVSVELLEYERSCDAYVATGQAVPAKRQRLPNGTTTFGYVMKISRSSSGRHRFEAHVDADDKLAAGTSASVTLRVGSGTRGTARSATASPAC
jgi:hypothetical protein